MPISRSQSTASETVETLRAPRLMLSVPRLIEQTVILENKLALTSHHKIGLNFDSSAKKAVLYFQHDSLIPCEQLLNTMMRKTFQFPDIPLVLELPAGEISDFTKKTVRKFISKYPMFEAHQPAVLMPKNVYPEESWVVGELAALHEVLIRKKRNFAKRMTTYASWLSLLKQLEHLLVNHAQETGIIYEFFALHGLCQTQSIYDLPTLNLALQSQNQEALQEFHQLLLRLLSLDQETILQYLSLNKIGLNQETPANESSERARARAFWGYIAYQNYIEPHLGAYWFGRYLYETLAKEENDTEMRHNGLYWLRIALHYYSLPEAETYLKNQKELYQQNQIILSPSHQYQLTMALMKPEHDNTVIDQLWPDQNFIWHTVLYFFNKIDQGELETEKKFERGTKFLSYLLKDDLLSLSRKNELLKKLESERRIFSMALGLREPAIKETIQDVCRYSQVPLAQELNRFVLPLLKKKYDSSQKPKIDPDTAIQTQDLALRIRVFSTVFHDALKKYIDEQILFGTPFSANHHPSYIAVLTHEVLTQGLVYFELNETELAKKLHLAMQHIRSSIHEHFFRQHQFKNSSFHFENRILERIRSNYQVGLLAKTAEITLKSDPQSHSTSKTPHSSASELSFKAANGAACVIEILHFSVPWILTALGLPSIYFTSVSNGVLQGIVMGFEKLYKAVETVEKTLFSTQRLSDSLLKILHVIHLAGKAGFKGHSGSKGASEEEKKLLLLLQHFSNLLDHVAGKLTDRDQLLSDHWGAVYQPVTDQLCASSNEILGNMLVEFLFRGLAARVLEDSEKSTNKIFFPDSLAEFLVFCDETLWKYTPVNETDNIPLKTKSGEVIPALEVIFPSNFRVLSARKEITVQVSSRTFPANSYFRLKKPEPRYASDAELLFIKHAMQHPNDKKSPITWKAEENPHLGANEYFRLLTAYRRRNPLNVQLLLLNKTIGLQLLFNEACILTDHINLIFSRHSLSNEQHEALNSFYEMLIKLKTNLLKTMQSISAGEQVDTSALEKTRLFSLSDHSFSLETEVPLYLEYVSASLIILKNTHQWNIDLSGLRLASVPVQKLKKFVESINPNSIFKQSNVSIIAQPGTLFNQKSYRVYPDTKPDTKEVTQNATL